MIYLTLSAVLLAAAYGQGANFVCMTPCRVPLWSCINGGIPGHEIPRLQKCVSQMIEDGEVTDAQCTECYASKILEPDITFFPTLSPTTIMSGTRAPTSASVCTELRRKRICKDNPACMWDEGQKQCGLITADNTPSPTVGTGYIDEIKPCLTYCKDQAMSCAFNYGINTANLNAMRECVHEISFDLDSDLKSDECGNCIEDVFTVLGDPTSPPEGGFLFFADYMKFVASKGTVTRCETAGGKWKQGKNKTRCVPPKREKKLRCREITDMTVCLAAGCTDNKKKARCAGANKWEK